MGSLIHRLIDNVLMTAIDPLFPPPYNTKKSTEYVGMDYFEWNRFELIFTYEFKGREMIKIMI